MSTKRMERFQLYIQPEQRRMLEKISRTEHRDVAELVRSAIDRVYRTGRKVDEFEEALEKTFGVLKNRKEIRSGIEFQNKLRKRWDRSLSPF